MTEEIKREKEKIVTELKHFKTLKLKLNMK